jgi:hypothetical protein
VPPNKEKETNCFDITKISAPKIINIK